MPHNAVTFRQMIQGCHHLHAHVDRAVTFTKFLQDIANQILKL